eukprot:1001199-Pleurochrysis_carterae.AAC.1
MLSRWRRWAHHPHRRGLGGRVPWMNMRNGRRTCRLAWRPWRLAPGATRLSAQLATRFPLHLKIFRRVHGATKY